MEAVHEQVGARLQLVDPGVGTRARVGAGTAGRDRLAAVAGRGERICDLEQRLVGFHRRGLAGLAIVNDHAVALVALQSPEAHRRELEIAATSESACLRCAPRPVPSRR